MEGADRFIENYQICQVIRGQTMKCLIGIEKKLEDNTMLYREPMKINKDWSDMIRFFCSRNKSGGRVL